MGINEKEIQSVQADAEEAGSTKPLDPESEAAKLSERADELENALKQKLVPQEPGILEGIKNAVTGKEPELKTSPEFEEHDAWKERQNMLSKGFDALKNCLMS
jgi:hypothetical protein